MWYTAKVEPDMDHLERDLAVHMSNIGPEHWKALGVLIGYLKGKGMKGITIRNPRFIKAVIFCDSKCAAKNKPERVSEV